MTDLTDLVLGYDIPARPGMTEAEVQTPCLVLDLDALERNLVRMAALAREMGVALRPHGKMHKSADVARLQMEIGGAVGICAQKVSEAEAFVRAGIRDVLVSNQVRDPVKLDRLARLPLEGARIGVCLDDAAAVADLSAACRRHGTTVDALVEIDCGAGRCGAPTPAAALDVARAIAAAPGLRYAGVQAYHGGAQHLPTHAERAAAIDGALDRVRATLAVLTGAGLAPETVTGGGTGSFAFEGTSGLYTEIQCGSYAFMDADYARLTDAAGARLDATWEPALFLLASVLSTATPGRAVCDAGLKAQSVDSGLPIVAGRPGVAYLQASDEHGTLSDPGSVLKVNDRLRLVPGHCDPTCNLHDWYVGLRGGVVECLWPVTARGKGY